MRPIHLKLAPLTASATQIAASASPGAGAIVLAATAAMPIDAQAGTQFGLGRIITLVSGSDDSGITFTITGTDENGVAATEAVTGGSGSTVPSVNYYTSVTSITHTGSVAGTFSAGITGTTASAKLGMLPMPFYTRAQIPVAVTVSGTISYTVKQTFDDVTSASAVIANAGLLATKGLNGGTALTALSATNFDYVNTGVTGISLTIPTYSTNGYVVLNVVPPTNSN